LAELEIPSALSNLLPDEGKVDHVTNILGIYVLCKRIA
jgi:hypothetical protein